MTVDFIVKDPEIMNGEPTFAGHRITLSHMVRHLKAGYTVHEYAKMYHLPIDAVYAGLEWLDPDTD